MNIALYLQEEFGFCKLTPTLASAISEKYTKNCWVGFSQTSFYRYEQDSQLMAVENIKTSEVSFCVFKSINQVNLLKDCSLV